MKFSFLLSLCALLTSQVVFAQKTTETRNLASFKELVISGSADVVIVKGAEYKAVIEDDASNMNQLLTNVSNGTLSIKIASKYNFKKGTPKITIYMPEALTEIVVSGSAHVVSKGNFQYSDLEIALSGSGQIELSGTAKDIELSISGSAHADLSGIQTEEAEVSISGSGKVKLHVTKELEVSISGSGTVEYKGNPTNIEKHISGSGKVIAEK